MSRTGDFFHSIFHPAQETIPEAEESRPFSDYSNDDLLDQFRSENWSRIREDGREWELLQEIENRNASANGRDAATVVSFDGLSNEYGGYDSDSGWNTIWVNQNNIDNPYETLDTMIHEGNHGFQNEYTGTPGVYDPFTNDMMTAENARDRRNNLYNYATTGPEYDMQCNELDSNNTAAEFMLSQSDRYKDDPAFLEYLRGRDRHFSSVNQDLREYAAERDNLQLTQAEQAYKQGDLIDEEYKNIIRSVRDPDHTDVQAERSRKVGGEIADLRQQIERGNTETAGEEKNKDDNPFRQKNAPDITQEETPGEDYYYGMGM